MRAHVHNGEIHTAAAYMDKVEDEYPELVFYDHNSLEGEFEDPIVRREAKKNCLILHTIMIDGWVEQKNY